MKIVVTPMCEKIVLWAGICNYTVNKYPDTEENADIAVVLSKRQTKMPSLNIELNTFQQIREGIHMVSKELNGDSVTDEYIDKIFEHYDETSEIIKNLDNIREKNSQINVKVYSKFLKDIAEDLGFNIIEDDESSYDAIICPDYYLKNITENEEDCKIIVVPSHGNVVKDPVKRLISRYSIILDNI